MIRKGCLTDIEEICRMIKKVTADLDNKGIFQWDTIYPDKKTLTKDIEQQWLYVYEEDNQLKGIVVLNEEQDEAYNTLCWKFNDDKILIVHRLCISPEYQGQGIGKVLMQYAEDYARQSGYGAVRLDAFTKNPISCKLYETIGYIKVGTVTFRKGLFFCYEKSLR